MIFNLDDVRVGLKSVQPHNYISSSGFQVQSCIDPWTRVDIHDIISPDTSPRAHASVKFLRSLSASHAFPRGGPHQSFCSSDARAHSHQLRHRFRLLAVHVEFVVV